MNVVALLLNDKGIRVLKKLVATWLLRANVTVLIYVIKYCVCGLGPGVLYQKLHCLTRETT